MNKIDKPLMRLIKKIKTKCTNNQHYEWKSGHYYRHSKYWKYTKNITPTCLKIKAKCIHSWKNITYQNPSQEEISILNFLLVSNTKTSYLELSRPRWFTSRFFFFFFLGSEKWFNAAERKIWRQSITGKPFWEHKIGSSSISVQEIFPI